MYRQIGGAMMVGLFGIMAVWAHEMPQMKPASAGFQQVQQLVGKWQGTSSSPMEPQGKPGPITTEFRLTAAGSAVEENLMKGTPNEMVDMYVDEGGKLAMTHYCASGKSAAHGFEKRRPRTK